MLKAVSVAVGVMSIATSLSALAETKLATPKEITSYSIGVNLGRQIGQSKDAIDIDTFIVGLKDSFEGKKLQLSDEAMQKAMIAFRQEMEKKQMAQQPGAAEAASKNIKEGAAFLDANKAKEGVKVLPSGLQYKVIKEGSGAMPTAADTVITNYRGTTINGQVFDSSYDRGQPATFPVGGVIKGWTEALQLMKVGSKWQLFIPAELAYGERGAGQQIGPNAVLIFDIELMDIKK